MAMVMVMLRGAWKRRMFKRKATFASCTRRATISAWHARASSLARYAFLNCCECERQSRPTSCGSTRREAW